MQVTGEVFYNSLSIATWIGKSHSNTENIQGTAGLQVQWT